MNGIEVDLSRTDIQVIDDGYGNAETATSFENVTGTGFGDKITGNAAANSLYGSGGDDTLSGKGGRDYIDAGDGDDLVSGGKQGDMLIGGKGTDTVTYADAASGVTVDLNRGLASGGAGADQLKGFENVIGSAHDDVLKGVRGAASSTAALAMMCSLPPDSYIVVDTFVFDDAAFSVDDIRRFDVVIDRIQLDSDVFTALSPGTLDLDQFVEGAAALDADDHVIYDPTTGNLYYDPDGVGGTDQIQFAHLKEVGAGTLWSLPIRGDRVAFPRAGANPRSGMERPVVRPCARRPFVVHAAGLFLCFAFKSRGQVAHESRRPRRQAHRRMAAVRSASPSSAPANSGRCSCRRRRPRRASAS